MYYDEASGDFIDDYPSNDVHSSRSGVSRGSWLEGVLGEIMRAGTVAIIFTAGFLTGRYDVVPRIKEWVNSQCSQRTMARLDNSNAESATSTQEVSIRCCNCGGQFVVKNYRHLDVFDCVCPHCHARLRVKKE